MMGHQKYDKIDPRIIGVQDNSFNRDTGSSYAVLVP
jgi:hypothetical protein